MNEMLWITASGAVFLCFNFNNAVTVYCCAGFLSQPDSYSGMIDAAKSPTFYLCGENDIITLESAAFHSV